MPSKPAQIHIPTIHTYLSQAGNQTCPLCQQKLEHRYNDGGRKVVTLKGIVWVVKNYYGCINLECQLNKSFPAVYSSTLRRKKFGLDVWEKIIHYHFKRHLNFTQCSELMFDDWSVSIAKNTVRAICSFFEAASKLYLDEHTLINVQKNGRIVLALDGAQPVSGEPSLWLFTDRLTGHVLFAKLLESAPSPVLTEIMKEIEKIYGVGIVAVISDKQKSIVKAVKDFRRDIPHVFCQYHFLNHIFEPIAAKDSHLNTQIKKEIKNMAIIRNHGHKKAYEGEMSPNSVVKVFEPLIEELLCAISTCGDYYRVFPGCEAYENLSFVMEELQKITRSNLPLKHLRTLDLISAKIQGLLAQKHDIYEEIRSLEIDVIQLREILGKRTLKSTKIRKEMKQWIYKLQSRLRRRKLEYHPEFLKYRQPDYSISVEEIWQQWVRLEHSYHAGLYHSYDNQDLEPTNNAIEQTFHRVKAHFKSLLGRQNVSRAFQRHGGIYAQLEAENLDREAIHEILICHEIAFVEGYVRELESIYVVTKRNWRIREKLTGNIEIFAKNLGEMRKKMRGD